MTGKSYPHDEHERLSARHDWHSIQSLVPLVLAALVLAAAILVYLAHQQDLDRQARSANLLERALDREFISLSRDAGDLISSFNRRTTPMNHPEFGAQYIDSFQPLSPPFDALLLWNNKGESTFAKNLQNVSKDIGSLATHPILQQIRSDLFQVSAIGQVGLQNSQRYLAHGDELFMLDMFSLPDQTGLPVPNGQIPGGAILRLITQDQLEAIGQSTTLDNIRLAILDESSDSASGLLLPLSRSQSEVATHAIVWEDESMVRKLLPIMALMIAVVLLLSWSAWRQISRASRRIRKSNDALADFADSASDVMWEIDAKGYFSFISHDMPSMPDYATAMVGKALRESNVHISEGPRNIGMLRAILKQQAFRNLEVCFEAPGVEPRLLSVSGKPIVEGDGIAGWRGTATDVTDERKIQQEIKFHAEHDALTKLANRNLFSRLTEATLINSRAHDCQTMLGLIDLDGFKSVNDSLGHQMGDRVLMITAQRMSDWVEGRGHAARLGGDEFAVILNHVKDRQTAIDELNHLHQVLSEPILTGGISVFVRMSIGMVMYPDDGSHMEELLKNADFALYHAKNTSGAKVQPFSKLFGQSLKRRREVESSIEDGLRNNEFSLLYQPQVRLRDGQAEAVEALLRWDHPKLGAIEPSEFIPIAEDTGLIIPLSQWVLERACEDASRWQNMGIDLKLAINLSPVQVVHQDIVSEIHNVLRATDLAPENLILEITEGVLMEDMDRARNIFKEMTRLGIDIAVDDFGTGHSSLTYLAEFPITKIKLDKSFLDKVPDDYDACIIVSSVLKLGRELDIEVVIEGVERTEQIDWLKSVSSPIVQGFALARPLHLRDIHAHYGMAAE